MTVGLALCANPQAPFERAPVSYHQISLRAEIEPARNMPRLPNLLSLLGSVWTIGMAFGGTNGVVEPAGDVSPCVGQYFRDCASTSLAFTDSGIVSTYVGFIMSSRSHLTRTILFRRRKKGRRIPVRAMALNLAPSEAEEPRPATDFCRRDRRSPTEVECAAVRPGPPANSITNSGRHEPECAISVQNFERDGRAENSLIL